MLDSISRKYNKLVQLNPTEASNLKQLKLMRQRERKITINRDQKKTTFMVHDVNFTNIDDWDLIHKNNDSDSDVQESISNNTPYNNKSISGASLTDLINQRRRSIRDKLVNIQMAPQSEWRHSQSVKNPMRLNIKTDVIAHQMEKF